MQKILTVAIPVYNMEQYLSRCLDSVTGISNLDDVEILVVNDGSKDRSLEIAREYEARFPASVRVIDKPNGGWGSAINLSIREAKGKYYKSLDSDDWFDSYAFKKFVDDLKTIDADMVVTPLREVYEQGGEKVCNDFAERHRNHTMPFADYLTDGGAGSPIHSRCYRTSLLQDNEISVSERFYADLDYITLPLAFVKTIYVSDFILYQYFLGRDGQSVSVKGYRAHYKDFLAVSRRQISFYNKTGINAPEPIRRLLWNSLLGHLKWGYNLLMSPVYCGSLPGVKDDLKEFDRFIKENSPEAYKECGTIKKIRFIPYIRIWRSTGVNLLKLLKK